MKATILAVDDDPIILEMYQMLLGNDYSLHLVSSGKESLQYLDSRPRVDLILLDIMMPDLDGYEVCRRIRSNSLMSHVKIILVSAKMMLEDRLYGYEIGADDYITKPFDATELVAKIEIFLRLKTVEEVNLIKTNFINLLNHETRTLLTGIFGYTRLLRESTNLTHLEKSYADEILKSGEKLLQSCEKTLLLSDLKLGAVAVQKTRMPLNLFFSDYRQAFTESNYAKRCVLKFSGDQHIAVDADPKLFSSALSGLIDNAMKFAREGTVVDVTVKATRDRLRIEVANDGEKIPVEQQEDIFNEFSVQDLTHHHQGYGLSLALSRRIIEAHDGSLTVRNHADGPVFVIDMMTSPDSLTP